MYKQLVFCAIVLGMSLFGLVCFIAPHMVLTRFAFLDGEVAHRLWVMWGLGAALWGIALALLIEMFRPNARVHAELLVGALMLASFYFFAQQMAWWWIDDAGITFSYSRSLADGSGVTFQPGEPPTEGYSSTLWMLTLALASKLGFGIPMAAKALGISFGLITMAIVLYVVWRQTKGAMSVAMAGAAMTTAPFVVWASSGQEHALQGLLLLLAVCCAGLRRWRGAAAILLSLLVLTRPEAPLIVIAVVIGAVYWSWSREGRLDLKANLILGIVPFIAFVGLMIWRQVYFGDLFPNPYYAKATGNDFAGVLNPFGGGWTYILNGLQDSVLIAALPLMALALASLDARWKVIFLAVFGGHFLFVIFADGDWMGQYRFLMPGMAFFAITAGIGLARLPGQAPAYAGAVLAIVLSTTTVRQMDQFEARPTTPLSVVSEIGREFARASELLQIDEPLVAHHDAGGIAFDRSVGLVDLGGLVDRDIAKNMRNRAFLETYIFEERKPDFIFGAINFAALSGFTEAEAFTRDYVPLAFENRPVMRSALSHIRRENVVDVDGVEVERDAAGAILSVIVLDPS